MRTPAIVCTIILLAWPAAASAGERHPRRDGRAYERQVTHERLRTAPRTERRVYVERYDRDGYPSDTPYGPRYQTQEQEMQSRYDVATGRRGNIKEYWWRY